MPSSDSTPDKNKSKDVILTQNTDDFIIGDRVWVNGTNSGYIQYIGETQFSPGDWAGVVLDDYSGKNDGSVSGVRYFQCEPKRGVFARLHKLTRYPLTHYSKSSDSEGAKSPQNGSGSLSPSRGTPPPSLRASTPTRAASPGGMLSSRPKVGDRVIVNATSGSKTGYLRYLGVTDFAPGDWAGVELDEPLGKNNGTVAGKRYFDCTMKFGLFAPAHKVTKATGSAARDRRQGSHESLNSSLSSGTGKSTRSTLSTTLAATNTALQEAVREKEKHIDQLLKERDLERAEVIRASAQVDEVEQQLANLQKEHRKYVDESEKRTSRLRQLLEMAETERRRLTRQLDDEKRKVEDLQFRIEEEAITKDDLEVQTEQEKQRIEDLQRTLDDEKRKNKMLSEGKTTKDIIDDSIKRYRDEAESLRQRLKNAESRIRGLESSEAHRNTMAKSHLQEDLVKKEEIILQTQITLDNKKRELTSLQDRLAEMDRELEKYKIRQEKHLGTIDGLNLKLQKSETLVSNLSEDLHTVKINLADTERRLEANEEKCRDLSKQRSKLQEQVDSLMESNSANENTAYLTQELREKERLVEELEQRLQAANQEVAKSHDTEQSLREQHQMELKGAASRHEQEMKTMKEKYDAAKEQLQAKEEKILGLSQASSRLESKIEEKIEEIERLKGDLDFKDAQLSRHEARLQEADLKLEALQGQASLQQKLSMTQAERDILKVEKEEALKRLQVAEESRQRLLEQREQWSRERLRIQSEMEDRENQVRMLKKEVERLQSEFSSHREDLVKKLAETKFDTEVMEELQMQIESQRRVLAEVQKRLQTTENERDELHEELATTKALQVDTNELEKKTSSLQQELDDMKTSRRELEKELESLQRALEATQILLEQREQQISVYQQELSSFRAQQDKRERNTMSEVEKKQLENKIVELQVALARLQKTVNVPDSEHQKVLAEKEALENQVDFLNSVIVDMQKKNDDLKGRLEILETEVIFDGQVNLTPAPQQHATSRLFCDICDVFDLHDTDDCLRQSSGNRRNYERHPSNRCEESEMF